ncbi:MAG: hypothetical protein M5T61_20060 [Acidimicrobiia bacterium]|nr:hypothetical protein [Acidimicrobiia bacterium]
MPDEAMDAITTAIKAYRPRGLGTVEDGEARLAFVVATVAAVSWKTPKHARTAMTHAWAYTGWLAANGRALEQSAFTVAHIDAYLKARAFAKQGTR